MTTFAPGFTRPDADPEAPTLADVLDLAVVGGLVTREQVDAMTAVLDHGQAYDIDRTSAIPVSCACADGRHRGYRGDGRPHTAWVHTYSFTSGVRR